MGALTSFEKSLLIKLFRCTVMINSDKYKLAKTNLINLLRLPQVFETYSYDLAL
jgi:hypothetical protein